VNKLRRYRAALEAGADPTVVAGWIAAATAERNHAQSHIDRHGIHRSSSQWLETESRMGVGPDRCG
jgi:hypothetical protein